MLMQLLLIKVRLVTATTLVLEVVLALHVIKGRVERVEALVATIALMISCMASVVAVLVARSLQGEQSLTGGALVAERGGWRRVEWVEWDFVEVDVAVAARGARGG